MVASPPVAPDYSALLLPPTLAGAVRAANPKCGSTPTNVSLAGLSRAAFHSFLLAAEGGAGLGHFSPGAGHVFRYFHRKNPFQVGGPWRANVIKNPERSACPVVLVPFERPKSHTPLPFACLLLGSPFGPARRPFPRSVPAFPLVVLLTLACRLGSRPRPCLDQSYPWRHQWVRWFGPGPWAPPQVFFSGTRLGLCLACASAPGSGVFARSRTFVTEPG